MQFQYTLHVQKYADGLHQQLRVSFFFSLLISDKKRNKKRVDSTEMYVVQLFLTLYS